MPEFPATRFADAGATPAEVLQLQREFDRSDIAAQTGMDRYFASISITEIRDYLDTLREAGHLPNTPASEPEEVDESESMAADSDTGSTESAAKVGGKPSTDADDEGADDDGAPTED